MRGEHRDLAVHDVDRVHGAHIGALAAAVALVGGLRCVEQDVAGRLGVVGKGHEHELAGVGEHALLVLGVLRAGQAVERLLQLGDLLGVLGELLGTAGKLGREGVHLRGRHAKRLEGAVDEGLALGLVVDLEHHVALALDEVDGLAAPLLAQRDGVGVALLAGGGAALVADAARQVDADVAVLAQDRVPHLGRDVTHAGQDHLGGLRDMAQGARAGDVDHLVGLGGLADLVVEHLGGVHARHEGVGGAGRHAQAALAAVALDLERAVVVEEDGVSRANLQAQVAAGVLLLATHAHGGVALGDDLVIRRRPHGLSALLRGGSAHKGGLVGNLARDGLELLLQAYEFVEEVCHSVCLSLLAALCPNMKRARRSCARGPEVQRTHFAPHPYA